MGFCDDSVYRNTSFKGKQYSEGFRDFFGFCLVKMILRRMFLNCTQFLVLASGEVVRISVKGSSCLCEGK